MIRSSAPRNAALKLNVADVARRLRCSRWTALRTMKREGAAMGAEIAYPYEGRDGQRWRCDAAVFDAWLRAKGLAA